MRGFWINSYWLLDFSSPQNYYRFYGSFLLILFNYLTFTRLFYFNNWIILAWNIDKYVFMLFVEQIVTNDFMSKINQFLIRKDLWKLFKKSFVHLKKKKSKQEFSNYKTFSFFFVFLLLILIIINFFILGVISQRWKEAHMAYIIAKKLPNQVVYCVLWKKKNRKL